MKSAATTHHHSLQASQPATPRRRVHCNCNAAVILARRPLLLPSLPTLPRTALSCPSTRCVALRCVALPLPRPSGIPVRGVNAISQEPHSHPGLVAAFKRLNAGSIVSSRLVSYRLIQEPARFALARRLASKRELSSPEALPRILLDPNSIHKHAPALRIDFTYHSNSQSHSNSPQTINPPP